MFIAKFKATTDNLTNLLEWKEKDRKPRRCPTVLLPSVSFQIWLRSLLCFGHFFDRRVFFSESGHVREIKHIVIETRQCSHSYSLTVLLSA